MTFTATHTSGTNIIINTASLNTYLFKEPNVNFNVEKLIKTIKLSDGKILEVSEDLFENGFANKELNDFFGIKKLKSKESLNFLDKNGGIEMTTTKKIQIFPKKNISALLSTRFRDKFIFPWKDLLDHRIEPASSTVTPAVPGYTTPDLRKYGLGYGYWPGTPAGGPLLEPAYYTTGSLWPLDSGYVSDDYLGNKTVVGELLIGQAVESRNSSTDGSDYGNQITSSLLNYCPIAWYIDETDSWGGAPEALTSILPYTAHLGNPKGRTPFANDETKFIKNLKKYINYSLIPEYNISSLINSSTFSNLKSLLKTSSFEFLATGSINVLDKSDTFFISKNFNLNISSIILTRPYAEFYPANMSLKCVSVLSKTVTSINELNSATLDYYGYRQTSVPKIVKFLSTFYSPGSLYNSIKAGLPVGTRGHPTGSSFEDLFDPIGYLKNTVIQIDTGSVNPISSFSQIQSEEYKNIIKNFLTEEKNIFCKNNNLNYFSSIDENNFKVFTANKSYVLELNISLGRVDVNTSTGMINGANYFGSYVWGGKKYLSSTNNPPWHSFEHTVCTQWGASLQPAFETTKAPSFMRIIFTPTETRKYTIDEILAQISVQHLYNTASLCFTDQLSITSSFNLFEKETKNFNTVWSMKSKWEFPFLCTFSHSYNSRIFPTNGGLPAGGLWHEFCKLPEQDQGLFLTIRDVTNSGSLADQIGMKVPDTKRVGEVNFSKTISELLCIVPIRKTGPSFIEISKENKFVKQNEEYMQKYILPYKLDHLDNGQNPILFFALPIVDQWSQEDLSYIWQNLLPDNGVSFKEVNNVIKVDDPEVISLLKNKEIYFKIFKCKERASTNPHGTVGYNWPWDMFSLLELARIDLVQEI